MKPLTLTFIQLAPFVADCRRLRITDEDLQRLERMILENPEAGSVVSGTGAFENYGSLLVRVAEVRVEAFASDTL